MFGELLHELKNAVSEVRHGTATRTITVAKPWCAPARGIIEPVLRKYGVRIYDYSETARMVNPLTLLKGESKLSPLAFDQLERQIPQALPIAQVARVVVAEQQAAWAEYLLLRTNQLYQVGGYINRRNEQWAARHGGRMPPAWNEGKPWIEASCSSGIQAWQGVKNAVKEVQQPKASKTT